MALLRCIPALEKLKLEGDEAIGVNIVKRALEEPLRQIVLNAGLEGAVIVGRIRESKDENFGYNADTDEYRRPRSKLASSTRPRLPGSRCRTQRQSPR